MRLVRFSNLLDTVLLRDGYRCLRCGKRSSLVWSKKENTRYDPAQRKRVPVDPSIDDLGILCMSCAEKSMAEEAAAKLRKAEAEAKKAAMSKAQTCAFGTEWFQSGDPREKFSGDLTTKLRKHGGK